MTTHDLKTWPAFFQAIWEHKKTFDARKDDRNFQVGDTLVLKEYVPPGLDVQVAREAEYNHYTGREITAVVTYKLKDEFGIKDGYCALGFNIVSKKGEGAVTLADIPRDQTAHEAVAWTFGLKTEEYAPEIET